MDRVVEIVKAGRDNDGETKNEKIGDESETRNKNEK